MKKVTRKIKRKITLIKFFVSLGIFLIIFSSLFGIFGNKLITHLYPELLTGSSETMEQSQNSIPPDVIARINTQVLGAQSTDNTKKPPVVHVPILMYHYVEYVQDPGDKIRISLNTTPATLDLEIKTLKDAGYTFLRHKDLTRIMDGTLAIPPKPIVLTFDDGYRDFYTDAYPILKKYNVKATQYVISGFLDRPNYMLTSQVQELAKNGLIEIGAHTVDHLWLKGLPSSTVSFEINQSKKQLEDIIKKSVVSFAYPYGAFDTQAIDTVMNAGFSSAVTTVLGIDQPQSNKFFLYRIRPGGLTGKALLSYLNSVQNN